MSFIFQEIQEARQKHNKTVMKNIEKRKKTSKELRKKTKKGQPLMKTQIEYMLGKISGKN